MPKAIIPKQITFQVETNSTKETNSSNPSRSHKRTIRRLLTLCAAASDGNLYLEIWRSLQPESKRHISSQWHEMFPSLQTYSVAAKDIPLVQLIRVTHYVTLPMLEIAKLPVCDRYPPHPSLHQPESEYAFRLYACIIRMHPLYLQNQKSLSQTILFALSLHPMSIRASVATGHAFPSGLMARNCMYNLKGEAQEYGPPDLPYRV